MQTFVPRVSRHFVIGHRVDTEVLAAAVTRTTMDQLRSMSALPKLPPGVQVDGRYMRNVFTTLYPHLVAHYAAHRHSDVAQVHAVIREVLPSAAVARIKSMPSGRPKEQARATIALLLAVSRHRVLTLLKEYRRAEK